MAVFSRDVFRIYPCDPNPFDSTTTVRYSIPSGMDVRLSIKDAGGALVRQLVEGYRTPGLHAEVWDGRDQHGRPVQPGSYRCRLVAGPFVDTVVLTRVEERRPAAAGRRGAIRAVPDASSAATEQPRP